MVMIGYVNDVGIFRNVEQICQKLQMDGQHKLGTYRGSGSQTYHIKIFRTVESYTTVCLADMGSNIFVFESI